MYIEESRIISKEDYMMLLRATKEETNDYVRNIANNSLFPPNAYGFYKPNFKVVNGEYMVTWERFESCD